MKNIYYCTDKRHKKWRVDVRLKRINDTLIIRESFYTEKEARKFLIKANRRILKEKAARAMKNALKRLRGEV